MLQIGRKKTSTASPFLQQRSGHLINICQPLCVNGCVGIIAMVIVVSMPVFAKKMPLGTLPGACVGEFLMLLVSRQHNFASSHHQGKPEIAAHVGTNCFESHSSASNEFPFHLIGCVSCDLAFDDRQEKNLLKKEKASAGQTKVVHMPITCNISSFLNVSNGRS